MSPLFDNEDWSRSGGPDVPLPSFLRDDPADIPGPADVSFAFQVQGPSYNRIAPPSRAARSEHPAGHTYAMPATRTPHRFPAGADVGPAYQDAVDSAPAYPGSTYPAATYTAPAYTAPTYAGPSYAGPSYAEPHHAEPAYGEPFAPAGPGLDAPASSVWDPLFDPWPPPGSLSTSDAGWPLPGQPAWDQLPSDHPSGPLPRTPSADWSAVPPDDYDVTLPGALGYVELGFHGGRWFSLGGVDPRPISTRDALRAHPELGGPIVQVVCWWMRENATDPRALDLATELALAVGELSREAAGLVR
jgi:hypothetical protein